MEEDKKNKNSIENPSSSTDSSGHSGSEDPSGSTRQIQKDLEKKCDEYLNNWKRAVADLANYKKDEIERMAKLMQYGKEDMIEKILPILDSVYYATKHIKDEGLTQIWQQATEFLKKEGVEEIITEEKKFNPEIMEIVEEVEVEPASALSSGVVKEELQKGYMMNGKVLRPAKVKVTK